MVHNSTRTPKFQMMCFLICALLMVGGAELDKAAGDKRKYPEPFHYSEASLTQRNCFDEITTEILSDEVDSQNDDWDVIQLRLAARSYCTYITKYSTKIEFDKKDGVEVYYYPYQGNNLPLLGACMLQEKTKRYLNPGDNEIDTGLFFGLFDNVCGYYVVLHNADQ